MIPEDVIEDVLKEVEATVLGVWTAAFVRLGEAVVAELALLSLLDRL